MERWEMTFSGLVQGIGLRPMIYHLARNHHLTGSVQNTDQGVRLFWQGNIESLTKARSELSAFLRQFGLFQSVQLKHKLIKEDGFLIKPSIGEAIASDIVSIDLSTCQDCLEEMNDPNNRRFHYPFITCAQCGPRYSIVTGLPFDRHHTAMEEFALCAACQREYTTPENRRFHAQTISCFACGPKLWLCDKNGKQIASQEKAIERSLTLLSKGKILAVKGIGGFHLMILANHHDAVKMLRSRKHRPHKPFALMVKNLASAKALCYLSSLEIKTLASPQAPILIARRRQNDNLSPLISPQLNHFGLMLPYTPLHHLLLSQLESPLIATSGNLCKGPICYQNDEALSTLNGIADYFLMHNRNIINPLEDSVVQKIAHKIRTLRKARGYIPFTLPSLSEDPQLAMGGHLKNSLALNSRSKIYLSPYIGDLDSDETLHRFHQQFNQFYRHANKPLLICDKHPDYTSSQVAKMHPTPLLRVQHHLAHIFAVCAEFRIKGDFIGFAWDGLGYATPRHFWGGETFLFREEKLTHLATLQKISLLGGEKAIYEPRRIALSLFDSHSLPHRVTKHFQEHELAILKKMQSQRFLTYTTSSIGRLFDGISVLLGGPPIVSYEAQAAIYLEQLAYQCTEAPSAYELKMSQGSPMVIKWHHLLEQILSDLTEEVSEPVIAMKFHLWCQEAICSITNLSNRKQVILSGGVFQNKLLTELTMERLQKQKIRVFYPEQIPANDGGLALGQISALHYLKMNKECLDVLSNPS